MLQDRITEKFLATLAEGNRVPAQIIAQLRKALENGSKPKVTDLVRIFKRSVNEVSGDQA